MESFSPAVRLENAEGKLVPESIGKSFQVFFCGDQKLVKNLHSARPIASSQFSVINWRIGFGNHPNDVERFGPGGRTSRSLGPRNLFGPGAPKFRFNPEMAISLTTFASVGLISITCSMSLHNSKHYTARRLTRKHLTRTSPGSV